MEANTEIVLTLKSRKISTPKDIEDIIDYLRGRIEKALKNIYSYGRQG